MLVIVLGARGVRGLATQSDSVLRVSLAVLTVCMVSHSLHVSLGVSVSGVSVPRLAPVLSRYGVEWRC